MCAFDILVGIPLIYAAYKGFRSGIVVQACGLIGLFAGVYLAFRYGETVGEWMHVEPAAARAAGFAVILLLTLLSIALLGHLLRGIFRIAGLGPLDAVGGVLLGVVKMALILSVLLQLFESVNSRSHWVDSRRYTGAALYKPLNETSCWLFPYLNLAADRITGRDE